MCNQVSGCLTITHPFHPFFGQSYKILQKRFVKNQNTLLLRCPEKGDFIVPEEWTNLNSFSENLDNSYNEISVDCVIKLCELVKKMQK